MLPHACDFECCGCKRTNLDLNLALFSRHAVVRRWDVLEVLLEVLHWEVLEKKKVISPLLAGCHSGWRDLCRWTAAGGPPQAALDGGATQPSPPALCPRRADKS